MVPSGLEHENTGLFEQKKIYIYALEFQISQFEKAKNLGIMVKKPVYLGKTPGDLSTGSRRIKTGSLACEQAL